MSVETQGRLPALLPASSGLRLVTPGARAAVGGWDSLSAKVFCVGLVTLVFIDWLGDYFKNPMFTAVGRMARAGLLAYFMFYIMRTGPMFWKHGFSFGRPLFVLALSLFIYAPLDREPLAGVYFYARILYWIAATVMAYRLLRIGALTIGMVEKTVRWIVFVAFAFTLAYMRRPEFETDYNASAYLLLLTLPLLLLKENRSRLDVIFFSAALIGIIVTVKRGAVLALVLSTIAYLLVNLYVARNARHTLRLIVIGLAFLAIGGMTAMVRWERIQERTTQDKLFDPEKAGSGRGRMFRRAWDGWVNGTIVVNIFGNGNRAYLFSHPDPNRRKPAHSDLFTFLHDYGLYGIGMLLYLHAHFALLLWKLVRRRNIMAGAVAFSWVSLIGMNVYTSAVVNPNQIMMGLFLAVVTAELGRPERYRLRLVNAGAPPAPARQPRPLPAAGTI